MKDLILGHNNTKKCDFTLPADAITNKFAFMGISGAGKTCAATAMAEEFCKLGLPWIALDPLSNWWGLRANRDGKPGGFPVVVIGGEHADIKLEKDAGVRIAQSLIHENVCAVIDLSWESKTVWRKFLTDFCHALMDMTPEVPRHIFIEEAPEFCLTPDTEVLTKNGWKKYDQIQEGDLAVSFDTSREVYEYEPIQRIIVKEHRGELVRMQSRALDCLMTPDHRAVIRRFQHDPARYKLYPWTFCEGDRLPILFQVPSGGAPGGPGINELSDDLLRVIGWVITDGYYHYAKKSKNLGLEQSSGTVKMGRRMRNEMAEVLTRSGCKSMYERPARQSKGPQGPINGKASTCFYFGKDLSAQVNEWLGDNLHRVPRILMENCSEPQLRVLYEGLLEGDGTSQDGKWRFFYPGLDEGLADDFQELATRLGVRTVKSFVKQNGQWRVAIAPKTNHWVRRSKSRVPYAGTVWCITVESGAFVARRNGRVFVTGNCPQRTKIAVTAACKEAVERLVRLGRNRGYGISLITQRPATVDKDVLTQCENLVVMRTSHKIDRKALRDWLEAKGTEEDIDECFKEMASLPGGAAYFWSPHWLNRFDRVQFRKRLSFHPGETRQVGVSLKQVSLSNVDDFVERLKKQLEKAPKPFRGKAIDVPHLPQAGPLPASGPASAFTVSEDKLHAEADALRTRVTTLEGQLRDERKLRATAESRMEGVRKRLEPEYKSLKTLFETLTPENGAGITVNVAAYEPWLQKAGRRGCRRALEIMLERPELSRDQLATLAAIAGGARSSTFRAYMAWLKRNGLIEVDGDILRLKEV